MLNNPCFDVKRPRPKRLSDPHYDFTPGLLRDPLAIPDEAMQWNHYMALLGPYLPAGTYEESVYFLPRAFDYLWTHEEDALEMITSLVWFASEYHAELAADGLLSSVRDCLRDCLRRWTAEFRVVHYDKSACEAKGWRIDYDDQVEFIEVVAEMTCDLVRFKTHADLAVEFTLRLAAHLSLPTQAAWFLEYARSRADVRTPPDYAPVNLLLANRNLLTEAAETVRRELLPYELSPTYWNDTLTQLRL